MKRNIRKAIAVTFWGQSYLVKNIFYDEYGKIICCEITDENNSNGMMLCRNDIVLLAKFKTNNNENTIKKPVLPAGKFDDSDKWWAYLRYLH